MGGKVPRSIRSDKAIDQPCQPYGGDQWIFYSCNARIVGGGQDTPSSPWNTFCIHSDVLGMQSATSLIFLAVFLNEAACNVSNS